MSRFLLPYQSAFDLNGHPLDGALLYFYETGTGTPKDTYSDEGLTTPNTNPVVANNQGEFDDIFMSGAYRVELQDKNGVTQPNYPADNVPGQSGDTVLNIAALKLIEGSSEQHVYMLGGVTAGDDDGGHFYWNATSTATDNNDTVIQATGVPTGRWLRLSKNKIIVNTLAELKIAPVGVGVLMLGHTSVGDGGFGEFWWDSTSTETDDGGTIIQATGVATGRWKRLFGGEVDAAWFGVVSDGTTDDATAVQAAIDYFTDYVGGELYIAPNTAIGSTITITLKKSLTIKGRQESASTFPAALNAAFIPTLKWIGASGGTMVQITDILRFSLRDMSISGEKTADYGLKFSGTTSGWGLGNYYNLTVHSCNKNAVLKTATASAGDFGRNHWVRCSFRNQHASSGTAVDDAVYAYNDDSGVQDVFDHCEFLSLDETTGLAVVGSYAMWIEAGTPRIHLHDCYTKAENGIYTKSSGATPKFLIADHYSEDLNFVSFANANSPQVLRNCVHALGGGSSIIWGGSSGGGVPLIIDGGFFKGSVTLTNSNAGVIINNSPKFEAAYPTFTVDGGKLIIGRANGTATAATDTHAAINAACFVPTVAASQSGASIVANLETGTVFPILLTANMGVNAPATVDPDGLDLGREVEFQITGDAGSAFTVAFNAAYLKVGGAYTHSGIGALDIIAFRYDGTNWIETRRSMDVR